jgi:autotransporter-associated beta strand protein
LWATASNQFADTSVVIFNPDADKSVAFVLNNCNETVEGISDTTGRGVIMNRANSTTSGTGTLTVKNTHDYTFNGKINNYWSGTDTSLALIKDGPGTLTLGAANFFKGGLTVQGGTLKMGHSQCLGGYDNVVTVLDGGAIDFNGYARSDLNTAPTINGTGVNNTGALLNSSSNDAGDSAHGVVLGSDSSIGVTGTGNLILGDVSGSYSLTKVGSGAGSLVLGGSLSYTGDTDVDAGVLSLSHLGLNDASAVYIASGAVLDLAFDGIDNVRALYLNGVAMGAGIYNAGNSGGYITGSGSLNIVPEPGSVTLLLTGLIGLIAYAWRRRR